MEFFSPKGFKNGAYYFNKYDMRDLLILIPTCVSALIVFIFGVFMMSVTENFIYLIVALIVAFLMVSTAIILTIPIDIYHNFLGKILSYINFKTKQKKFIWRGYDYDNYSEDEED